MSRPAQTLCVHTKSGSEGSGWFGQELAQAIAQTGTTVIYVAPAAVPQSREPTSPHVRRVTVPTNSTSGGRLARFLSSLRRIRGGWAGCLGARRATRDYLFSIPDPLGFFLPLQLLLRLTGARLHLVVHDALPHAWALPPRFQFIQRAGLALSYRLCATLLPTTGAGQRDLMSHFGIPADRISVVPHGAYLIQGVGAPPDRMAFLLFGTLRRNKGVLEAIEAIQLCRKAGLPVTLKIAGAPDRIEPDYWQACLGQISLAPEGIETEVGFVPDDAVQDLISASDAVLLPYRDFTSQSGVAILMVSGARPVVASAIGGIGDLFADGMTGIALSERPSATEVAEAIKAFCAIDSATWHGRALQARDDINARIGWGPIGHRYMNAIFRDGAGEQK